MKEFELCGRDENRMRGPHGKSMDRPQDLISFSLIRNRLGQAQKQRKGKGPDDAMEEEEGTWRLLVTCLKH